MGSRPLEWARTHQFESSAVVRTAILRFLAEQADDDGYIADHAGDKGVAFIMHETCASKSTVIRTLKEFEAAGLIHREKRPYKDFGGKMTDLIVLNLSQPGTKTPWRTAKALKQIHRASRAAFGAPIEDLDSYEQPVDNPVSPIGVTLTPNPETPSQQVGVSLTPNSKIPSQQQGVTLTPKPDLGVTLTQVRCHSDTLSESALKGNARATHALKGNLLTDNQSISQSVTSSTGAREKMTDGLTGANQILKNLPAQPIGAMPAEVAQLQLRTAINRSTPGLLDSVDGPTLDAIMRLLVSREERRGKQVQNPVGFCIRAIGNEPGGIEALTALATIERYTAQETQPAAVPAPLPAAPVAFCQVHTREYTGHCPLCAKEAVGQLKIQEPAPAVDRQAGAAFRESIRARRTSHTPQKPKNAA